MSQFAVSQPAGSAFSVEAKAPRTGKPPDRNRSTQLLQLEDEELASTGILKPNSRMEAHIRSTAASFFLGLRA